MSISTPQKGVLLLSEPFMLDPNFKRSVVFLSEHNEEDGTVGFILNKSMNMTLEEVMPDVDNFKAELFYGGPVQPDTLHFLHNLGDLLEGSVHVIDDVYWGGNFEELKVMIQQKVVSPDNFKFFLGYSGWSPGQLEDELKEKSWIITKAISDYVFKNMPQSLWKKVLQNMGGEYKLIATFPEDPTLN